MTCSCSVRVEDAAVFIRPCAAHRRLQGNARLVWIGDVLTRALYTTLDEVELGPRVAAAIR